MACNGWPLFQSAVGFFPQWQGMYPVICHRSIAPLAYFICLDYHVNLCDVWVDLILLIENKDRLMDFLIMKREMLEMLKVG